jgi:hypothetical protein
MKQTSYIDATASVHPRNRSHVGEMVGADGNDEIFVISYAPADQFS